MILKKREKRKIVPLDNFFYEPVGSVRRRVQEKQNGSKHVREDFCL